MESVIGTPLDKNIDWDELVSKNKSVMCTRATKAQKSGNDVNWQKFVEASKEFLPVIQYRSMDTDQLFNKQMNEAVQYFVVKREHIRLEKLKEGDDTDDKEDAEVNKITGPAISELFKSVTKTRGPTSTTILENYTDSTNGYYDGFLGRYVMPEKSKLKDVSLKKPKISTETKFAKAAEAFHSVPSMQDIQKQQQSEQQLQKQQLQKGQDKQRHQQQKNHQQQQQLLLQQQQQQKLLCLLHQQQHHLNHQQNQYQQQHNPQQQLQQQIQQQLLLQQQHQQQQFGFKKIMVPGHLAPPKAVVQTCPTYQQWSEKQISLTHNIENALQNGRDIIKKVHDLPTMYMNALH